MPVMSYFCGTIAFIGVVGIVFVSSSPFSGYWGDRLWCYVTRVRDLRASRCRAIPAIPRLVVLKPWGGPLKVPAR